MHNTKDVHLFKASFGNSTHYKKTQNFDDKPTSLFTCL